MKKTKIFTLLLGLGLVASTALGLGGKTSTPVNAASKQLTASWEYIFGVNQSEKEKGKIDIPWEFGMDGANKEKQYSYGVNIYYFDALTYTTNKVNPNEALIIDFVPIDKCNGIMYTKEFIGGKLANAGYTEPMTLKFSMNILAKADSGYTNSKYYNMTKPFEYTPTAGAINRARGAEVKVESEFKENGYTYAGKNLVDGSEDPHNAWRSKFQNPKSWAMLKLNSVLLLSELHFNWKDGGASGSTYVAYVTNEYEGTLADLTPEVARTWTKFGEIKDHGPNNRIDKMIAETPVNAQYIFVDFIKAANNGNWGYNLVELLAFGDVIAVDDYAAFKSYMDTVTCDMMVQNAKLVSEKASALYAKLNGTEVGLANVDIVANSGGQTYAQRYNYIISYTNYLLTQPSSLSVLFGGENNEGLFAVIAIAVTLGLGLTLIATRKFKRN